MKKATLLCVALCIGGTLTILRTCKKGTCEQGHTKESFENSATEEDTNAVDITQGHTEEKTEE